MRTEMNTIEKFTRAGMDFIMSMHACVLCGWESARGASYYFHGNNGFGIFMSGLGSGKLLAAQVIEAYGFDMQTLDKIRNAVLSQLHLEFLGTRRGEREEVAR